MKLNALVSAMSLNAAATSSSAIKAHSKFGIRLSIALLMLVLSTTAVRAQNNPPTAVTLAVVQAQTLINQAQLLGTSESHRASSLSARVAGIVTQVLVDVGQEVEQGDVLLTLDDELARLDLEAAQARVSEAEARVRDAIRVRNELRRLQQGKHVSQTEIDSAIAQVEISQAALRGSRAEVARLEEVIRRHQLPAPYAGMVVNKNVEAGQWVDRDDATLVLMSLDTIRVRATVSQRDFALIGNGLSAQVRFDALPEQLFTGRVVARVAAGDARTRTFPVLIDLPNPDHSVAPGMSARVRVGLSPAAKPVLVVPRDAVIIKSDGTRQVWHVSQDDQGDYIARPVQVETGQAKGELIAVQGVGLSDGDKVVLLGNENLKAGQKIMPAQAVSAKDQADAMVTGGAN